MAILAQCLVLPPAAKLSLTTREIYFHILLHHCNPMQAPNIAYVEMPLAELLEWSLKLSSLTTANQVCL